MRRVAPHPQWEIFSSYGLLVGAFWKISWEMRCYYTCAQLKAGFILYPIHTLHIRMPSPSVLEPPRVSKAAQVSVARTEHISEQQGDINRPGDKNRPTIVFQEVSFLPNKNPKLTLCFLVATSNESMSTKLFLKLLLFCSFFVFGRCFFRPKHQSVAGWKTVPEAFDVPVSLQTGRLRKFYGSLPCPEVKSKTDGCLWQEMIWLGDWNLGLGNDWLMGW